MIMPPSLGSAARSPYIQTVHGRARLQPNAAIESVRGEAATVDAVWAVRRTAGGSVRSGRTVAREAVQGEGFDALAAAHSRAVARMSDDIASAIRGEAERQP